MTEQDKANLRASLIDTIDSWWEDYSLDHHLPWVGDNTLYHMADAMLAVILALEDTQEYLARERVLETQ